MKRLILLSASLAVASCALAQQPLTFTTEPYPPFTYQEADGAIKGVGPDQIVAIMHDANMTFSMEMMPWARAIALAETNEGHCVFAAARTPDREDRFKWVVPLYVDRSILVRHAGASVHATTLEEARLYVVGTHREDYTEGLLKSLGFPRIDLSSGVDITLGKLLADRIDLMPMSEGVYEKLRADGKPIEKVVLLSEQQLGIACNRNVPDAIIAKMQAGLDKLIAAGTQQAIIRAYGLGNPK